MPQSTCHKANLTTFLALAAALAVAAEGHAAELHVPGGYSTIQAAIDAAVAGDEIILAPGTYNENINLLCKSITLRSTEPENPDVVLATIIHGDGTDSTIRCIGCGTMDTGIDGLVIRNEPPSGPQNLQGGGMRIIHSGGTLVVSNCVFYGLEATIGGAVYIASPNFAFTDCTFSSCRAVSSTSGSFVGEGGALHTSSSSGTFDGCAFRGNHAAWEGGAVRMQIGGTATFTNCTFEGNMVGRPDNEASTNGIGSAIRYVAPPTLIGCTVRANSGYADSELSARAAAFGTSEMSTQMPTLIAL